MMTPSTSNKKILIISIACIVFSIKGTAQDLNFTQYNAFIIYLNPATTGYINEDMRIGTQYKCQWKSLNAPFVSYGLFLESRIPFCFLNRDNVAVGMYAVSDKAGSGSYRTSNYMVTVTYVKAFDRYNRFKASVGFSFGAGNKSINYKDLVFPSQWTGNGINQTLPPDIESANSSIWYLDMNGGLFIRDSISNKFGFHFGLGLDHILQPTYKFLQLDASSVTWKPLIHGGCYFAIQDRTYIEPSFFYAIQDKSSDFLAGVNLHYLLISQNSDYPDRRKIIYKKNLVINIGLWVRILPFRNIIPIVGVDYDLWSCAMSYQANLLTTYPGTLKGGFEISIQRKLRIDRWKNKCGDCRKFF
jgi:type IX secretion system PorP/SprF family membrane protein